MRKELLDDIIELKETRKILEAACGEDNINRNSLSRNERIVLDQLRHNLHVREMLHDVEEQIDTEESEFRNEYVSKYL